MKHFHLFLLLLVTAIVRSAGAADFPPVYNSEAGNPSPPAAMAALAMLKLPPGFQATLFAAEPDVQNPIALAWDHRGRMWVAENYTYAESKKRFELALRDRVIILEDKDHDGCAESRKVFTDDVQMLTSVEVGRGGVWMMCPPQLLFVPDANGDDIPDGPPQVMLDGFTVARDNYHNFANGLHWGPDGWLYGRCGHSCPGSLGTPGTPDAQRIAIEGGVWRFHPERKVVEVLVHGTTNPWGHDWDQHGEGFFINTVNGHLWHLIPGAHFKESFGTDPNPGVYERLDMIADHWHFDTKGTWQGSRDGKANDFGGGHAHIGMMIYQADQWPESFRNKLYTLNMHGRRANVERLERTGSGYIGRHEPDVFFTDDTWFRGLEISTGPDGAGYLLDWCDTGECHESTGVHRTSGRIYKVTCGKPTPPSFTDLETLTLEGMERLLQNPNVWYERQLRTRLMTGKPVPGAIDRLWVMASNTDNATVLRLRALWAWYAISGAPEKRVRQLLTDEDEHLRVWAIRLLSDELPIDRITGPGPEVAPSVDETLLRSFVDMAERDSSGLVRLTLASTLQRLPVSHRAELATALVRDAAYAADHNLPSMVWYGIITLGRSDPMALVKVAESCQWPDTLRWIARNLATRIESVPEPLKRLLHFTAGMTPALRLGVLQGIAEGLKGWRKAPKPANWDALAAVVTGTGDESAKTLVRDLSAVFGDGLAMDAVKKIALDDKADLTAREKALTTLIDARPPELRSICEALLDTRILNATAVRGLASYDDPQIGASLAKRYRKFQAGERPVVISALVTRPAWAMALLDEMNREAIPRAELTAFHARQIRAFKDEVLSKKLTEVWGELRDSPADKRLLINQLKTSLTPAVLAKANLSQGRQLHATLCATCHTLYGEGGKIGPDLTGSGRANIDYLLENIVDPGAVVGADYRMTILTLNDGRLLSGVIAAKTERTLTLRQLTGDTVVEISDITKQDTAPVSMMPEGQLQPLQPDQIRDLIAYLMHPAQVPLPAGK